MFPDFESKSARLYERACKVMPGGNTRTSLFWPPYQIYADRGSGSRIVDVDGTERTDFHYNFTVLIHGHSHPSIVRQVQEQVSRLTCVSCTTESEVLLAELLCSRIPSFEKVRFTNSGTEACMNALKAARALTGRSKVAKCEGAYHGTLDIFEVSISSTPENWGDGQRPAAIAASKGTPEGIIDEVVIIPFNDPVGAERILNEHAEELAAVFIDVMPLRIGLIPAAPEFLKVVRDFTRKNGVILILDEVISFRLGYCGGQTEFGIEPDLTTIGKFIGGGFPVGAIAGKEKFMEVFDPRGKGPIVWHGGTFNANPVTMTAGLAAMELLTKESFERLSKLGHLARERIGEVFRIAEVPWQVTGRGSLFRIHPSNRELKNYRSYYQGLEEKKRIEWLMVYLLNHGIMMFRVGVGVLSTVTTEEEIEQLAEAVLSGLREMKHQGLAE
jgi:glutamate-1-semialdehyde 2,1-aminomutase